jgi:PTS system galactitol-specific IIA component
LSAAQPFLHKHLILRQVEGDNAKEVMSRMANALLKHGHVKPGFEQAVLDREEAQPTGLPVSSCGIAIPHADPQFVLHPAICVGFPERPVTFRVMGDEEATLQVRVIFMLAIDGSEQQLTLFQKLMDLIQDESLMSRLLASDTADAAAQLLTDHLS